MTAVAAEVPRARLRLDRWEVGGAFADLGVLVPIAVALIVTNGLSPTAVLLPAGLLYVAAGLVYRLPVPVQPLKAFGAIAIAEGLGAGEIAAGSLLMGAIFVALGASGLIDLAARAFPKPLVRGVQLTVGLLFLKIAWGLVTAPPASFDRHGVPTVLLALLALVVLATLSLRRRLPIALALVGVAVAVIAFTEGGAVALGPSALELPTLGGAAFWTALTVLVLPQLPLSFANSCLATADAARTYFGAAASRVTPGRLAATFGTANLLSGAIGGMPVCHGAGGLTAHYSFGARTGGAPIVIGVTLLVAALGIGAGLGVLLAAFPLSILGGLLAGAGVLHIGLLRDLERGPALALAAAIGVLGLLTNIAVGLVAGLVVWWGGRALLALRRRRSN
ncbi:MAG TPA: putative sulfate/molybdate transporter [Gaiellaceae bacterium]|nr:putative sulfate/molybdate transporter [Gaiellaceae bacterium]